MATNFNQENAEIASEIDIPRLLNARRQKNYYQINFRGCVKLLGWISVVNVLLILIILYLFFTRPSETYYATSFDGKNTLIDHYSFEKATMITQQNKIQGNNP